MIYVQKIDNARVKYEITICCRQNNDLPLSAKDICVLIPGTCEYVMLNGKRD